MGTREPWEVTREEAIAKLSAHLATELAGLSQLGDYDLADRLNEAYEEDGSYPMHYTIVDEEEEEEDESMTRLDVRRPFTE